MQVQFLGGASGVGATCQLIEIVGEHVLVDAAGLSDLAALQGVCVAMEQKVRLSDTG
ncbi:MAG: hypothetical protein H7Z42_17360 [Roseiflexaceae bacterium]|nr:hypothetical protein [Roseiflexaceae bacterium]